MSRHCDWKSHEAKNGDTPGWLKITIEAVGPVINEDNTETMERLRGTIWVCPKCAQEKEETSLKELWDYAFGDLESLEVLQT
jgi:hypothetical protein